MMREAPKKNFGVFFFSILIFVILSFPSKLLGEGGSVKSGVSIVRHVNCSILGLGNSVFSLQFTYLKHSFFYNFFN